MEYLCFFFFSSRRRHTRWTGDWSSDVCSSDLLNVGHLMLLLQFGNMGKDLAKYNTKLFAEKVMPQLTDVFSEWEDRWWPQPMPRAERAAPASFQPTAFAAD